MSEQQNLVDILRGYSSFSVGEQEYFFKHPTVFEKIGETPKEAELKKRGQNIGLLTEEELIKRSFSGGKWSEEDESEFNHLTKAIRRGSRAKSNITDPNLLKDYEKTLERNKKELKNLSERRLSIISSSLENYVINMLYLDMCRERCFVDQSLKKKIPEDKAKEILAFYIESYQNLTSLDSLLKASYLPDFFETIRLSTDPLFVYGKIAKDLTIFQRDLLVCGKLLKTKIENIDKIPQRVMNDAIELYHYIPKEKDQESAPINIRQNVENKGGIENMTAADKIT